MNTADKVEILKALADPTRLDIVRRLSNEPADVPSGDLISSCSSATKLSQPAMSHHFGKLVDAGILQEHKVGTEKHYKLNCDLLNKIGIDPAKL